MGVLVSLHWYICLWFSTDTWFQCRRDNWGGGVCSNLEGAESCCSQLPGLLSQGVTGPCSLPDLLILPKKQNPKLCKSNKIHFQASLGEPLFFGVLVTNFIKRYKTSARRSPSLATSNSRVDYRSKAIAAASLWAWRSLFSFHPPGPFGSM